MTSTTPPTTSTDERPVPVAVLPFGAIEQHGPTLPPDTDARLAEALAARIVEAARAEDLPVRLLPTLPYGASAEHEGWPETFSLRAETALALLRDLGHSMTRALPGWRLLVINGHGGNRSVIDLALRDLRRHGRRHGGRHAGQGGLIGAAFSLGDVPLDATPPLSGIDRIHGGRLEAALLMALGVLSASPEPSPMREALGGLSHLGPGKVGKLAWMAEDLAPGGSIHGPVPATRADGEAFLTQLTEAGLAVLRDLMHYDAPGQIS